MQQLAEYVRDYVAQLSGPRAEDAWHSLVDAGPKALPYVVEAFHAAGDDHVRVSLIQVVGQYRSAEAVPFLAVLLRHREPMVWKTALDSLVMIGGQAALDALAAAGTTTTADRREWITEAVQQVVERLRSR